jgi:hypothetical protein
MIEVALSFTSHLITEVLHGVHFLLWQRFIQASFKYILSYVDLLLGNDHEISYTIAVAR